jgi:hypothetical protein
LPEETEQIRSWIARTCRGLARQHLERAAAAAKDGKLVECCQAMTFARQSLRTF